MDNLASIHETAYNKNISVNRMNKPKVAVSDFLEQVLDEMHEGIQIISKDFRYLYVNDIVARQGKKRKDELLGNTMMDCYPGIEKTSLFTQLKKCLKERVSIRMDNEFVYPDKSTGWFRLIIHPCSEGVLILSLDINEGKKAEEQLLDKIEELQKLTNISVTREIKMAQLKQIVVKMRGLMPDTDPQIIARPELLQKLGVG